MKGRSRPLRGAEHEFQATILQNFPQNALFGVPGGRVTRMADQLSVQLPAPCELRAYSGGLQAPDPAEFASLSHIRARKSLASRSAAVV